MFEELTLFEAPSHHKLFIVMEAALSDLALLWRDRKETDGAKEIARQYQAILKCMLELGFDTPLDVESELPGRLMPREYLTMLGRR